MDEKMGTAFTVTLGEVLGEKKICFISVTPNGCSVNWADAENTRKLIQNLKEMVDIIDPPPKEWRIVSGPDEDMVAAIQERASDVLKHAEAASAIIQEARKRVRKAKARKKHR